jgi:hypothetical protein
LQENELQHVLTIKSLSILNFETGGEVLYGADQEWYAGPWKREAGCGPTAGASLLWYLARTRPECACLAPEEHTKDAMLRHMKRVWQYVKPGIKGVNRTDIFRDGVSRYASERGVALTVDVMNIPVAKKDRPDRNQVAAFLQTALEQDQPVAFLNLGSGGEKRLQNWHWVTLVGFSPEELICWIYDEGKKKEFDLALWLETSPKGGGFVTICN